MFKKVKKYLKGPNFIQDLILSITPSLIFGVLFYSNNSHLVHFDDSVFRFLRFLSLLFFVWILLTKKIFFLKYGPFGFSFAFCFIVLFNYSFYGNILIYVLTLLFSIIIYLLRKHIQVIYIFTFFLISTQVIQGYFKYKHQAIIEKLNLNIQQYDQPLKKSYSVYYFLADGYSSYKLLITQDKLDNSPFINWLASKGFSTNKNAYSNYGATYTSMKATFQMKHHYYKDMNLYTRETSDAKYIMAGGNPVIARFYNNDFSVYMNVFSTKAIHGDDETILKQEKWDGTIKKVNMHSKKKDIFWFIEYYNRYTGSPYLFNYKSKPQNIDTIPFTNPYKDKLVNKYRYPYFLNISNIKDNNVKFVYLHFHFYGDYAECKRKSPQETNREIYVRLIQCNNEDFKKSIEYILKNDPNSIIILQSDHGPGQGEGRPGPGNVSGSYVQRQFGILFSVRWPEDCKYLGKEKYTPVNLFPRVFACLNGEKPNYQNMAKDDAYMMGIMGIMGNRGNYKNKKQDEVFKVIENNEILPEFR